MRLGDHLLSHTCKHSARSAQKMRFISTPNRSQCVLVRLQRERIFLRTISRRSKAPRYPEPAHLHRLTHAHLLRLYDIIGFYRQKTGFQVYQCQNRSHPISNVQSTNAALPISISRRYRTYLPRTHHRYTFTNKSHTPVTQWYNNSLKTRRKMVLLS